MQESGDISTTRLVLEETATSPLGGCIGLSDRFIAGFYWLHALGMVGEAGFQQVNRQDLVGYSFTARPSQYALVGQPGWVNGAGLLQPHPDYFTVRMPRVDSLVFVPCGISHCHLGDPSFCCL